MSDRGYVRHAAGALTAAILVAAVITAPPALAKQAPEVSIADASAIEGDAGTTPLVFEITLSHKWNKPLSLDWYTGENNNAYGWATAYDDVVPTGGRITIPAGATTARVTVDVVGDNVDEPDEIFFVDVFDTDSTWGREAVGTIVDDDAPVTPTVSIADASAIEGNTSIEHMRFAVSLSESTTHDVSISWTTHASGDMLHAADSTDFTAASGTITIPVGATEGAIDVSVLGDLVPELDETFAIRLTSTGGGELGDDSATGTILNDDPISFSVPV